MACALSIGGCAASADLGGSGGAAGFGGTGGVGGTAGAGGSSGSAGSAGSSGWGGVGGVGGSAGTSGSGGTGGTGGTAGSGGDPRQPIVIDECMPTTGISAEDIAKLKAGGDTSLIRFLYPYEDTVFPRGMKSPDIMWETALSLVAYVRMQSSLFDYQGCFFLTQDLRIQLPQHVWDTAGQQTLGPSDPFTISLTTMYADSVRGPIQRKIVIAQATLSGSIYYNSYSSPQAPNGGAVLRIPPGGDAEVFVGDTQCIGCHSVSANGSRLIADSDGYGTQPPPPFLGGFGFGGGAGGTGGATGPAVFAITPTTQPNPAALRQPAAYVSFAGLSPDGSVYIANAPSYITTVSTTPPSALLIETDTGVELPLSGISYTATMPSFAPDGRFATYIDISATNDSVVNDLMLVDYDAAQRHFSGARNIVHGSDSFIGWPFVLPDNQGIVYTRSQSDSTYTGTGSGYYADVATLEVMDPTMRTELFVVDVETKQQIRLDRAMGYNPTLPTIDATYLPYGATELGRAYYPTVSPVAAGGYFWVFFDSVRHYGMLGPQRQLWGTAISISPDGTYDSDPSHPAFYLPGQEFGTGNHRAFTALDPCRSDGTSCDTGIDCCSGYCINNMCGTPEQPRCAERGERCQDRSDCCNSYDYCLSGFCSEVLPE